AEDGIRDRNVTGVQTCALPISKINTPANSRCTSFPESRSILVRPSTLSVPVISVVCPFVTIVTFGKLLRRSCNTESAINLSPNRSEERREGKECRYRVARTQYR